MATHVPTIIIVDDHTGLQALLCQILLDAGYSVRSAAHRPAALRMLQEKTPAIIVMDWRHDGMSARQFVESVHQQFSEVDLIVTTTNEPGAHAASELGVRHVLRKPFRVDELIDAVGNCAAQVVRAS